jgi:hypothetical protein
MLEVKAEGFDALLKKFETLDAQILELHKKVPEQLVEWQTVEMRRQYPNVHVDETPQSVEASTEIWPRSRLEEPGSGFKRPRPVGKKGPTMARIKNIGRPPPSTRPILRTELFTKLADRMDRIVQEAMKWP